MEVTTPAPGDTTGAGAVESEDVVYLKLPRDEADAKFLKEGADEPTGPFPSGVQSTEPQQSARVE